MSKKIKASFTVEAAVVFPTILIVLISILYLSFYLYDRVKAESAVNHILEQGRDYILYNIDPYTGLMDKEAYLNKSAVYFLNGYEEEERYLQQYALVYGTDIFFISKIKESNIQVKHNVLQIEITIDITIPTRQIKKFFAGSGFTYTYKKEISLKKREEYVRLFEVTYGVGTKIEAVNKAVEALRRWLK